MFFVGVMVGSLLAVFVLAEDANFKKQAGGVHLHAQVECAARRGWGLVEGDEDAAEVVEDSGLSDVAAVTGGTGIDRVAEEEDVGLIARAGIQRTGGVVDLGKEALGCVEMVGDGGVSGFSGERAMAVDGGVDGYVAVRDTDVAEVETEGHGNEEGCEGEACGGAEEEALNFSCQASGFRRDL